MVCVKLCVVCKDWGELRRTRVRIYSFPVETPDYSSDSNPFSILICPSRILLSIESK